MSEPKSMVEFGVKYQANLRYEGFGGQTKTIFPCPGCAEPDWLEFPVTAAMDEYKSVQLPKQCAKCGRTFRLVITRTATEIRQELIQLGGADLPDWYEPKPRRVPT